MDRLKLIEFDSLNNLNKFSYDSNILFSDGMNMYNWFRYNKKEILISDDAICKKIKQDYDKFSKIKQEESILLTRNSINYTLLKKNMIMEFINYPSSDKFDIRKNILFKNGDKMAAWFIENQNRIFNSKDSEFLEIQNQYNKYISLQKSKKLLIEKKYKSLFYSIKDFKKFDITCDITFSDGSYVGVWFYNNINQIKNSKSALDEAIMKQYKTYLNSKTIEKEFIDADISKFDFDSCARFSTGASMSFWWECMMDKILKLNDPLSKEIQNQYKKYLQLKKQEEENKKFEGVTFIKK